jgi:hypothetical protein
MLSPDESLAFNNYFVSIEVVLNKELQRIYFPVPRACREQINNPVVQDQIEGTDPTKTVHNTFSSSWAACHTHAVEYSLQEYD